MEDIVPKTICRNPCENTLNANEQQKFFKRNYIAFCLLGGLQTGGLSFVSAGTVIPPLIESLDGPLWLISLMPIMLALGVGWPPIFTSHKIEKLETYKSFVAKTLILQRIPYLLTGIILLFATKKYYWLALSAVALSPFLYGLFGGIAVTAWQGMVIKTIPNNRRSSAAAIQNTLSCVLGMAAGGIIAWVLTLYPGTRGYGILHLIAFAMVMLSFQVFMTMREPKVKNTNSKYPENLWASLKEMPSLIVKDKRFLNYLISRSLFSGIYIAAPFLSIYALKTMGKAESYLGFLVTAQMIGSITGNFLSGYMGDRFGGRIVMILSQGSLVFICIFAAVATSSWGFLFVFFLYGMALSANVVGNTALSLEICPRERQTAYLSIMMSLGLPSMLAASFLSTITWKWSQSFLYASLLSALFMAFSVFNLLRLIEPRKNLSTE